MKKFFLVFCLAAAALGSWFAFNRKEIVYSGESVGDFALTDESGDFFQLHNQKVPKAVVLITHGLGCPIIEKSIPAVNELAEKYAQAKFYFINSNTEDTREAAAKAHEEFQMKIPLLLDPTQRVAKLLKYDRTGEAIVIETKTWKIVYRGPVDDRLGYGIDKLNSERKPLEDAVAAVLSGKAVKVARLETQGCAISFNEMPAIEYHKDVAPILAFHCSGCHELAGVKPTNLFSYRELRGWRKMLDEVIRTERMPPWEVDVEHVQFRQSLKMTDAEKSILFAWVEQGAKEGKPLPPAVRPPRVEINADFVLAMQKQVIMPARSTRPWHYEEVISGAEEEFWISGFQPVMKNLAVVQHLELLVTEKPLDLSAKTFLGENVGADQLYSRIRLSNQGIPTDLPDGQAYRIPKGAHVYIGLHLAPSGKTEKVYAKVNIRKADPKKPLNEIIYMPMNAEKFEIPPNSPDFPIVMKRQVDRDTYLVAAGAHMHLRGKSAKLTEVMADGTRKVLFNTRYLFKNRRIYSFKDPVFVQAGSTLEAELRFDNSVNNPARISPDQKVEFGPDAFKEEMAQMHLLQYYKDGGKRPAVDSTAKIAGH